MSDLVERVARAMTEGEDDSLSPTDKWRARVAIWAMAGWIATQPDTDTRLLRHSIYKELVEQRMDLRPEAQEVVDEVKAIIAPFKERIEALEGEVATLREDRDSHQRQCIAAIARAERLRVAGQKILAKLDHPTASVTQWDADELRKAIEDE